MNMEFEEYLSDDEELHMAYLNSYDVIVMGADIKSIIDSDIYMFVHDPSYPYEKEDVLLLLKYFEDIEDYERCIIIKDFYDESYL